MRSSLMAAADEIIEGYRNSSDRQIQDFDWAKAAVCLRHALEINPSDREARGKLALSNGYVNLLHASAAPGGQDRILVDAAQRDFEEAVVLLPRSPDPHLGLARLYVYARRNIGKALAEFHAAERLGFRSGPREIEEQADGYRFRANLELNEARKVRAKSRAAAERYLQLAERDFERARQLYEPILGYSDVNVALRQVDVNDRLREQLGASLNKPLKRTARSAVRRAGRWQ
jgi:hypothetical protein